MIRKSNRTKMFSTVSRAVFPLLGEYWFKSDEIASQAFFYFKK